MRITRKQLRKLLREHVDVAASMSFPDNPYDIDNDQELISQMEMLAYVNPGNYSTEQIQDFVDNYQSTVLEKEEIESSRDMSEDEKLTKLYYDINDSLQHARIVSMQLLANAGMISRKGES